MNSNDKPQFSRTPGGMSVRAIIKAKDVKRTPEYHVRSHALGMLQHMIDVCFKVDEDATRDILRDRAYVAK